MEIEILIGILWFITIVGAVGVTRVFAHAAGFSDAFEDIAKRERKEKEIEKAQEYVALLADVQNLKAEINELKKKPSPEVDECYPYAKGDYE